MPLESFIASARKFKQETVQRQSFSPPKPIPTPVGAAESKGLQSLNGTKRPSLSTSVNAIARELEGKKALRTVLNQKACWENCKCLKRGGEKLFCTKFFALCAQGDCPKRYIEM